MNIGQMVIWRFGPEGPSQYPDVVDVSNVVDEIHLSAPGAMFVLYTKDHLDSFTLDQLSQINTDVEQRNQQSRNVYVWKNVAGQWRPIPEGASSPILYPLPTIYELLREAAGTYFFVIAP